MATRSQECWVCGAETGLLGPYSSFCSAHAAVDKPPVRSWPLTTGDVHLDSVNPFATELPGAMLLHGVLDVFPKTYHGPDARGTKSALHAKILKISNTE